jgi:hypothetical protein
MSATWQVQQSLYTALATDSAFMTKIGNRLFDEPRTDETYPYVTIGNMLELRFNKLVGVGYEVTAIFAIYTKSGRLCFKVAKEILEDMNRVLNRKIFSMTSLKMVQCYYDSSDNERDEDKRIINARYLIIVEE